MSAAESICELDGLRAENRKLRKMVEKLPELEAQRDTLAEMLKLWTYDGCLQTFEDRERFRKAARAALAGDQPQPRLESLLDPWGD